MESVDKKPRTRRHFTDEQKRQILSAIREGVTLTEASRRSGIHVQNLRRWMKEGHGSTSSSKEMSQVMTLKRENALLKDLLFQVLKSNKAA